MTIIKSTNARSDLYHLIGETTETHQPIVITGKRKNAVLVSESDWPDAVLLSLSCVKHYSSNALSKINYPAASYLADTRLSLRESGVLTPSRHSG